MFFPFLAFDFFVVFHVVLQNVRCVTECALRYRMCVALQNVRCVTECVLRYRRCVAYGVCCLLSMARKNMVGVVWCVLPQGVVCYCGKGMVVSLTMCVVCQITVVRV